MSLFTPKVATLPDGRTYTPSVGKHPRSLEPSLLKRSITKIVLIIVALYFILPLIWILFASTKSNVAMQNSFAFWFADENNVAANYKELIGWSHNNFWWWVFNSVLYSGIAGVVGTFISVAAGYGLAKFKFRGSGTVQLMILAGLLLPIALLTIPLYTVMTYLHLNNTMWAVIIPSCVSPFGVFLGRMYAETSVPDELLEAARIDGSGEFRTFFTMVLRLLAPAMVTIFLFIFVATWNNFLLPLMMIQTESKMPVTLGLYGMMSYFDAQKGAVIMGALFGVIPLIVIFLFLQRFWQAGLAAGSVKG
ncbi:ABC transporter permease [Boudabousia liubingyangii]|uniref:ABC transporter permease n=1 Tax=Boudabousia liubingyangii TaxID=1921764 RepID=A0A1Q5PLK2_9ACTO|nr:carbohydrate ABC transporter permease [Boudabousia liubingyangii]OKL46960.1 ABC transporter permease [Boudabousia liubingyangii]OKL47932.1 ABC transporter permease [Boudabousia liubingyangii]